jgi:imipenem/basic amino acid-specific outer membrane pore
MQPLGIPGLTFMAKHLRGRDIDGTRVSENSAYFGFFGKSEKERETDLSVQYVIQGGPLKDLKTKLFQSWHSGAQSTGGSVMQTRLVLSYPFDFF